MTSTPARPLKRKPARGRAIRRSARASRRCPRPPRSPAPARWRRPSAWPASNGDSARDQRGAPRASACACVGRAAARPGRPARPAIAARSDGPRPPRTPSLSKIRATPTNRRLSPPRNSDARLASRVNAPQSSRRSANSGRVTAPTMAISTMPRCLERAKQLADFAKMNPEMRKGFDPLVRRPDDARPSPDRGRAGCAARATCIGKSPPPHRMASGLPGASPAPPDGEAFGGQTHTLSSLPARGMQIARSPPSRRKSRIRRTSACAANSAATSSTRSFNVPSGANSAR